MMGALCQTICCCASVSTRTLGSAFSKSVKLSGLTRLHTAYVHILDDLTHHVPDGRFHIESVREIHQLPF